MKHIPKSELKVGMVVVCGDSERAATSCWRYNDEVVPKRILAIPNEHERRVINETLDGRSRDFCGCDDLNHLYLYEEPMKTLKDVQIGDWLVDTDGTFARVLGVMGEGELKVVVRSRWTPAKTHEDTNKISSIFTVYELEKQGVKLEGEITEVEMTMEEVNKALGKTVKIVE